MAPRRILLLMDNRADANWGSQATTTALFSLIQERFPDAEITGLPRSVCRASSTLTRHVATRLAPLLVRRRSFINGWTLGALTAGWEDEFQNADLVIVNGEGTLHPQPQATRWICAVTALARKHEKPYWVVNTSLECKGDPTEDLYSAFFSEAEYVAAREPASLREMVRLDVSATQAADCAFLTEPAPRSEAKEIVAKADITGAFAVMTGSATVRNWSLANQRAVVAELRNRGLQVLYAYSEKRDKENLAQVGENIPSIDENDATFQQLTAIQREAEIVVGGRFHPTILAAIVGTPFVAIPSNTHKMNGLMELLGTPELLCDFGDQDRIVPLVRKVLDQRSVFSQRLLDKVAECRDLARKNVPTA